MPNNFRKFCDEVRIEMESTNSVAEDPIVAGAYRGMFESLVLHMDADLDSRGESEDVQEVALDDREKVYRELVTDIFGSP